MSSEFDLKVDVIGKCDFVGNIGAITEHDFMKRGRDRKAYKWTDRKKREREKGEQTYRYTHIHTDIHTYIQN